MADSLADHLFAACVAQPPDVAAVAGLLVRGADPNARGWSGHALFGDEVTALAAIMPRLPEGADPDPELARMLLAAGADPNAVGRHRGYTPLLLAAAYNRTDLVRLLLDAGADPNRTSSDPYACCALAACIGAPPEISLPTLRLLLEGGASPHLFGPSGQSPLFRAIAVNQRPVIEALLAAGADPNAFGLDGIGGETAFHHAILCWPDDELLAFLVRAGADPNARGRGDAHLPLWRPVFDGRLDRVDLLLGLGADLDLRDGEGLTVLAHLIGWPRRIDPAIVEGLLARGADVEAPDRDDATLLHRAVRAQAVEVVEALLRRGADPTRRDAEGRTPLDLARALDLPLVAAALGASTPAEAPEPTAFLLSLVANGLPVEAAGERWVQERGAFTFQRADEPRNPERWAGEMVRERFAWLLLRDDAAAAALAACFDRGRAALGQPPLGLEALRRELLAREPERVDRARLEPGPGDVARLLEAYLRAGGSLGHGDKEGCSSWSFDASAPPASAFSFYEAGDHCPEGRTERFDAATFRALRRSLSFRARAAARLAPRARRGGGGAAPVGRADAAGVADGERRLNAINPSRRLLRIRRRRRGRGRARPPGG